MDESNALEIIRMLADGVDPETGEIFPADSPYQQSDTICALHTAVAALETVQKQQQRKRTRPDRQGQPWTADEDRQLRKEHEAGQKPKTIARKHHRTTGAITSRLTKLGLLPLS